MDYYLFGHLDELGSRTNGSTGNNATVLENIGRLNNYNVNVVVRPVPGVEALITKN